MGQEGADSDYRLVKLGQGKYAFQAGNCIFLLLVLACSLSVTRRQRSNLFVAGAGLVVILLGSSLISIITAALQVCYVRAPEAFAGQVGAIVSGPQACTISATGGQTAITITGYTPEPRARTLVAGGQLYQVAVTASGTTELVEPWAGTTGSFAAQIYCDAIEITSTFHHCWAMLRLRATGRSLPLPTGRPSSICAMAGSPATTGNSGPSSARPP